MSRPACPGRRDTLDLDSGLERAAVDVNAQGSLVARGQRAVGGEKHAGPADVDHLDRSDERHRRRLIVDALPRRAATLTSIRTAVNVVRIHFNQLVPGCPPICT